MDWKKRLRHARELRKLTKSQFAREVGISAATATDWEKPVEDGGISKIAGDNLVKVCEVLQIDAGYLMDGVEPTQPGTAGTGDDFRQAAELVALFGQIAPALRPRAYRAARQALIDVGRVDLRQMLASNGHHS